MESSFRRILLICDYPPATYAGGPIILRALFKTYPPDRLFVAAPRYLNRVAQRSGALECWYYDLPLLDPATRYIGRFLKIVNLFLIPVSVVRTLRIVRKQRIEVLFTVPASTVAAVAYLVHKLTGIDLYVYVMDDYDESMRHQGAVFRLLNGIVSQKRLLRSARKVWAISEYMAEFFHETYGVKARALPHSVSLDEYRADRRATRPRDGVIRLAHVGAIYGMQLDAIRNVVRMVRQHNRVGTGEKIELRLYIGLWDDAVERLGIRLGDGVVRDHVPPEEMAEALHRADILLLAYAFDPRQRQNVSTSLPTKTAEYLASGVPVLVHAPPYATVSRYARQYGFGVVADVPDPETLRAEVLKLVRDPLLQARLTENAVRTARRFHDVTKVVPSFLAEFTEREASACCAD